MTRSGATRRAMRKMPSGVVSRSWPRSVASSAAASASGGGEGLALERGEQRGGVPGERVHERLARGPVLPVAERLARLRVVVIPAQQGAQVDLPLVPRPPAGPGCPRAAG